MRVNSVILFPKELSVKLLCTAADFCPVADHEQVSEVFEIHRYESMNCTIGGQKGVKKCGCISCLSL